MTTYYIEQDGQIKLHDTDKTRIENTLKFMPQYAGLELKETERPIENCEWADTDSYIAKKHLQDLQNQVNTLESETGLNRVLREIVTSSEITTSKYVQDKIAEIEELAEQLRK